MSLRHPKFHSESSHQTEYLCGDHFVNLRSKYLVQLLIFFHHAAKDSGLHRLPDVNLKKKLVLELIAWKKADDLIVASSICLDTVGVSSLLS